MLKILTTAHGWRCSLIKPDDPEDMGNPPDSPRLGWVERLVIRLIMPKDYREEFEADLLEEYEEIRREKGDAAAMSWRRDQLLRSVVPLLRRRLERLIPAALFVYFRPLVPLFRRRVARMLPLLVVVYFLPVLFLGLLLHGVSIIIRSSVDLVRRVKSPASSTPRWIVIWILRMLLPRRYRDEFFGDLREERTRIEEYFGKAEAKRWLRKQVRRSIIPLLRRRLEKALETLGSEHVVARAVQIALCVYLLPALLGVIIVGLVGMVICYFVDHIGRFPPFRRLCQAVSVLPRFLAKVAKWVIKFFGSNRFIRCSVRFASPASFARVRHGCPLKSLVWSLASP
jgi:hypothetical protein